MRLFIFFLVLTNAAQSQQLHVMTFNIRYNTASDSLNAWTYRKDKVSSQILFHEIHLLGIQEALHGQVMDMRDSLKKFRYTGVGRDDGLQKGEYSAIFYDTTRLQLLSGGTRWLSEHPGIPGSKSWDAAITRIVTWGRFRDLRSRKIFFAFNTHFDHMGTIARRESAKFLLKMVREIAGAHPAIIMGDFNATPSDDPIRLMTDPTNKDNLVNAKKVSVKPHYGPSGTFNGFRSKEIHNDPIDYIFIKGRIKVLTHATISQTWEGRFASDHFAVMAVVEIR